MNRPGQSAPLALYAASVQDATAQVWVLEQIYARLRHGARARVLREDFAGAAAESLAWVARGPRREAIALERDAATLAWAQARAGSTLTARAFGRLHFVCGDVRTFRATRSLPKPDIICAFNFSLFYLHERAQLLSYFRRARRALGPGGLLIVNAFGGVEAIRPHLEVHPIVTDDPTLPPTFDYQWEVAAYDPVRARGDYRIHFAWRESGSRGRRKILRDAFRYDWRLWSLPELTGLLSEAGFAQAIVWRHTQDRKSGEIFFGPVDSMADRATWSAYVVGVA